MNNIYYQQQVQEWLIATFTRFWLWITHSDAIVCRGCGEEVLVEMLNQHTLTGCLKCQETKLRAVKRGA